MNIFDPNYYRGKEPTQLERELCITLGEPAEKSLLGQGNTFMEIFFQDGTILYGVYAGVTVDQYHVIRPSVFPSGNQSNNQQPGDKSPRQIDFTWLNEPQFIRVPIKGFRAMTEERCGSVAGNFNNVALYGKWITKEPKQSTQPSTQ